MPMKSSCTSRKRATRPLIKYSLCPERYNRRPTTISPAFIVIAAFSAPRFFQGLPFSYDAGAASETAAGVSPDADGASITATAFASSGSTKVSITSDNPIGGRFAVPLNMQSDMRSARSIRWLCSPSTQEIASTTFDLPHPFGPTMQVIPVPLKVIGVFSQKDLNPNNSTLRSFSTSFLAQFTHSTLVAEGASIDQSFFGEISRHKRWRVNNQGPYRLALPGRRLRE